MSTKLTFLGTGTSQGVPIIACDCPVCRSTDPRDKRYRASALVEYGGLTILIDGGPDMRSQLLREDVHHLDAVLLTHNHKDHTGGLDDLRSFNLLEGKPVNIYCEQYVEDTLRREYAYCFAEPHYPGSPEWRMNTIDGSHPFRVYSNAWEDRLEWISGKGYTRTPSGISREDVHSVEVVPIQGWHNKAGTLSVLGYRFGGIAYLTDMCRLEDSELGKLRGLDAVTLNCVKRGTHFSHFSLPEVLDLFEKIGARESYITHLSHMLPCHAEFEAELPEHVHPAYDGLTLISNE